MPFDEAEPKGDDELIVSTEYGMEKWLLLSARCQVTETAANPELPRQGSFAALVVGFLSLGFL